MNAGQAITAGMRAQRRKDLLRLKRGLSTSDRNAFDAWLMWGWHVYKRGGTGIPGATYPWWTEPKYLRR
jgi:hypothetical protein